MGQYLPRYDRMPRKSQLHRTREAVHRLHESGQVICTDTVYRVLPDLSPNTVGSHLRAMRKNREIRIKEYIPSSYGGRFLHVYEVLELKWET